MLRTTNNFSKKSCLETTYNYSAPQTLNMIEQLSAEPIQQDTVPKKIRGGTKKSWENIREPQ